MIETILAVGSMIVDGVNIAQFCRTLLGGNALKKEIDALLSAQQDQAAQLQKINEQLIYVANRDGLTKESSNSKDSSNSSEQAPNTDTKKSGLTLDEIVNNAQEIISKAHNSDENKEARLLGSAPIKVPENFLSTIVEGKKHDLELFLDSQPKHDNDAVMVVFSEGKDTCVGFTTQETLSKFGFKLNTPWQPNGKDLPSGIEQPGKDEWQHWGSESDIKESEEEQKKLEEEQKNLEEEQKNLEEEHRQNLIQQLLLKINEEREKIFAGWLSIIAMMIIGVIIGASIAALGIAFGIKIENTATGSVFWANSIGGLLVLVGSLFGLGAAINATIAGIIIGAIGGAIGGRIIWSVGIWLNSVIFWAVFWAIFSGIIIGIVAGIVLMEAYRELGKLKRILQTITTTSLD